MSKLSSGPGLQDFIRGGPTRTPADGLQADSEPSYLSQDLDLGNSRKVYFETYGCQMNVSDTDIACSILQNKGYQKTVHLNEVQCYYFIS